MAKTARQVCEYALRKVFGVGETPDATSMADAFERLDDMLALWHGIDAATGITLPLALSDTLACPASFLPAIQDNLIIAVADLYNREIPAQVAISARMGLQHVRSVTLPDVRVPADSIDYIVWDDSDYGEPTTPVPPTPGTPTAMDFSDPANSGLFLMFLRMTRGF